MVQAEDRCHRIGQTAAVKILYFVAQGTLDLLLWSLLEKKFRALGEFVEGQEKMKIVVQKTYQSKEELESTYFARVGGDDSDGDDEDEDRKVDATADGEYDQDGKDLVDFESQLGKEIDELEQEEMDLLKQGEDEDGDGGAGNDNRSGRQGSTGKIGRTEDQPIDLEEDTAESRELALPSGTTASASVANRYDHRDPEAFTSCRYYLQTYANPHGRFGLELILWHGRILVINNQHRMQTKPEAGDILVAVNRTHVPFEVRSLNQVLIFMAAEMKKGPVHLWFVEDDTFRPFGVAKVQEMKRLQYERKLQQLQLQQQFQQQQLQYQHHQQNFQQQRRQSSESIDAVIDLLDDNDD